MPCAIMRGREPAGSVQHARALSEVATERTLSSTTCIVGRYIFQDLELKMVAMSYEMSLCFGSTQPEPATDVRRTDRASKHA